MVVLELQSLRMHNRLLLFFIVLIILMDLLARVIQFWHFFVPLGYGYTLLGFWYLFILEFDILSVLSFDGRYGFVYPLFYTICLFLSLLLQN
jgi:hypothetical protein